MCRGWYATALPVDLILASSWLIARNRRVRVSEKTSRKRFDDLEIPVNHHRIPITPARPPGAQSISSWSKLKTHEIPFVHGESTILSDEFYLLNGEFSPQKIINSRTFPNIFTWKTRLTNHETSGINRTKNYEQITQMLHVIMEYLPAFARTKSPKWMVFPILSIIFPWKWSMAISGS